MAPPEICHLKTNKIRGTLISNDHRKVSYMLENPVVSNSTRKSENLFGADNQQERFMNFNEGVCILIKRYDPHIYGSHESFLRVGLISNQPLIEVHKYPQRLHANRLSKIR